MMISRSPNKRASIDKAPGPRKTIASATTPTKAMNSLDANRNGCGGWIKDAASAVALRTVRAPLTGVSKPDNSESPVAMASKPASQVLAAVSEPFVNSNTP